MSLPIIPQPSAQVRSGAHVMNAKDDDSWLDAETMPVLTWERADKYCQLSKPRGYTVCAVKCAAGEEFVFEAWHNKTMLKPWLMKAEDARAECQAHAIAAWRKHNKSGA